MLLLEQILAVEHHGAGFIDILLLLLAVEQVLSVMMLVMHGLMGWEWITVWKLGTRGPVH